MGQLPRKTGLLSGFCSSKQMFAYGFLQIPGHPGHPCFRLKDSGHYGSFRTWGLFSPHLLDLLHARHTNTRSPTAKGLESYSNFRYPFSNLPYLMRRIDNNQTVIMALNNSGKTW